jgi:hypothetical protein
MISLLSTIISVSEYSHSLVLNSIHGANCQPDNTVIFEENSKAIELEETFFKGKHLNINQFDDNFYDEVMGEYITMTLKHYKAQV